MPTRKPPPAFPTDDDAAMARLARGAPLLQGIEIKGEYLHWDELRHRTPPAGLTVDDWWILLDLARRNIQRPLPLRDQRDQSFRFANPDSLQRAVHTIDRDASGRIELPEDVANPATRDRYVVNSLIEESITSSQLEGASTTRKVAKEMIRSGRAPRTNDERMIFNNFRAMEWIRDRKTEVLTPAFVLELHRIITDGTLEDPGASGRLRRADEPIGVYDADGELVHDPPPAESLPERMKTMCTFATGKLDQGFVHPVVRSILLHFWLAFDHPFIDGNGRTARALFYWAMLREGYWLTEFLSISRLLKRSPAKYARAYVHVETTNDVTYFVIHQLKVLRQAIDDLTVYLKRKTREIREAEAILKDAAELNHRQIAMVAHALRHPTDELTIESHRRSHGVAYDTARKDLLDLVARGWFTHHKRGNAFVFRPVGDLARRAGQAAG